MSFLTNLGALLPLLGIIIFVHEFGHFITAKAFGMRVFVFSFGFGQRLFGFKRGDTDYRVSLVPLGGYVKLEGEADDHVSENTATLGDGRDFSVRPRWQRFLVYVAGPVMNVVLTVAVFTILFMRGMPVAAPLLDRPIVGSVVPGSPAAQAGIEAADEILEINGQHPRNWEDALVEIVLHPGTISMRIRHQGVERALELNAPANQQKQADIGVAPLVRIGDVLENSPAKAAGLRTDDGVLRIDGTPIRGFDDIPPKVTGALGRALQVEIYRDGQILTLPVTPAGGKIGIGNKFVLQKFGPAGAVVAAVRETWSTTRQTLKMLGDVITARTSARAALAGPVGIAKASGDAARSSAWDYLRLIALLSLSVGILNVLPLPPLDGGHLAIIAGEGIRRRNFSEMTKIWIMNAGATVLLMLIAVILYSDISKTHIGRFLP
jgi:regulator of sigma E protease